MIVDILDLVAGIWALGAIAIWLAALVIYVADKRGLDAARKLLKSAFVWPLVLIKLTIDIARKGEQ